MRNDVETHKYQILSEGVWTLDYPDGPVSKRWITGGWENTEYILTKKTALKRMEELKLKPNITFVWLTQYYTNLGWIANSRAPTYSQRWERKVGGEWRLVEMKRE